jgi:hypothetical protein
MRFRLVSDARKLAEFCPASCMGKIQNGANFRHLKEKKTSSLHSRKSFFSKQIITPRVMISKKVFALEFFDAYFGS